jgi:hypothetical protein
MITADKLALLTNMPAVMLQTALGKKGKSYELTSAKFLGITNGGQFCYHVDYKVDAKGQDSTKVYITYNPAEDKVIADIG